MKMIVKIMILMLSSLQLSADTNPNGTLVIAKTTYGFFSSFFSVLDNLAWCERNNVTPTVYWGKNSLYYQSGGYNGSENNVWEYYFEPISSVTYEPGMVDENIVVWDGYRAPDESRLIPQTHKKYYSIHLDKEFRKKVHGFIQKYINIKPEIIHKIDSFYDAYMAGNKTIGIHIRGTDKNLELNHETPLEIICKEANKIAVQYGSGYQFFIATDEQRLLDEAKRLLKGPVVFVNAYRSVNGKPIHDSEHDYSKAKAGEEVLIEAILLSKCDHLVHTRSRVSSAALFFNPEISNTMIDASTPL